MIHNYDYKIDNNKMREFIGKFVVNKETGCLFVLHMEVK